MRRYRMHRQGFVMVVSALAGFLAMGPAAGFGASMKPLAGARVPAHESVFGYAYWVQVAAHGPGLHGSRWRTDLGLRNLLDGFQAAVTVSFFPAAGGVPISMETQVAGGAQSVLEDVVAQLGASGSGALNVHSNAPLVVTSRTYNLVSGEADCTPGGTFGQYYAGHRSDDTLVTGDTAWLAHLAESSRFRTNLAFTNTGTTPAAVEVELFDGAGTSLATFVVSLNPRQYRQEMRVFLNRAGQSAMRRGSARVTVTRGAGVIASASVVDNITNDPTTIPAIRTEYAGGYATDLTFPFEDETLIGEGSHCYGLTNWNAPLNTEIHSGIDLAARYGDLAVDEARHVRIVAPAAGTGLYVYEMPSGKGADSILVLIQMNDFWYLPLTFEPQSMDAATSALQRESMAVDLSGLDCSTGCYFSRQIAKGEWIGDLIVRNVMEDAYPHIHYSLLYKSPAQTLEDAFANNLEIARNQGTGMPPTSGPGSPVSPMELAGTPTTFYCPYEYSSAAAKTIMDTMVMRSLNGICSCACAYNSVDGNCGVCP